MRCSLDPIQSRGCCLRTRGVGAAALPSRGTPSQVSAWGVTLTSRSGHASPWTQRDPPHAGKVPVHSALRAVSGAPAARPFRPASETPQASAASVARSLLASDAALWFLVLRASLGSSCAGSAAEAWLWPPLPLPLPPSGSCPLPLLELTVALILPSGHADSCSRGGMTVSLGGFQADLGADFGFALCSWGWFRGSGFGMGDSPPSKAGRPSLKEESYPY